MATFRTSQATGGTAGTSDRTCALTPAVGDLWVVFCAVSANTNDTPTCSDNNGGTYDLVDVGNYQSTVPTDYRLSCFVRKQLHVNTTSTTVTVATGSNNSGVVTIIAVSGMTRLGSVAVRQVAGQDAQASGTQVNPILAANALTGNMTIAAVACSTNLGTSPSFSAPTGMTEREEAGAATPAVGTEVCTRDSGFTGTTLAWTTSPTDYASVFLELDNTPPPDNPPPLKLAAALGLLLMAWQPMQPAQPARVQIAPTIGTVVTSDAPPRPPPQGIERISLAWQPAQIAQPLRVQIAPLIPTVTADDPPPLDRRRTNRIIGQWWKPVLHGTSGSAAPAVDEVPPSRPRLEQVLVQWTPAAPMPPRPRVFTPGYVPDQPPPATRTAITAITQAAWIPTPGLPPRAPALVQPATAAAVNDPPFDARRAAYGPIYSAWKWRAVGSGDAGPTPLADPVPPATRHPEILASWTPAPALPQLRLRSVPPQADTFQPAPSQRPEILASWAPTASLPQRPIPVATIPGVSVDAPPPTGTAGTLATIQAAWLQPPQAPQRKGPLSPGIPGQSVDQPPPLTRYALMGITQAAWSPTPGQPPRAPLLVQPSVAAPVNDPPFDSRRAALGPIYSAWKWRPVGSGDSAAVPPVVNDPPFARKPELRPMLSAWQPAPEQVIYVSRLVFEFVPDDPPFGLSRPLTPILSAWLPGPPAPQWGRHVPVSVAAVPVNDPPFGLRPSAPTILGSWAPPRMPVVAPPRAPIPEPVSAVNDPPFGQRPWLPTALAAWQPGPPRYQSGAHVPVSVSAVQVNDPPPLTRQPLAILSAWQPLPPLPPARPEVVQEAAAPAVDNPPPSARPLTAILSAWQPAPQSSQRAPQTPQVAADVADVPPTTRPWLGPILAGWQAPTLPAAPRPWLASLPGASVDAPPIQRPPALAIIRAAWEPPAPLPTLPGHLAQERPPDAPPFGLRSWLPAILTAWQPGPPAPQWGRHVPVSVSAVPVNDPPFGIRPWLPTVRALWIPGPPQPITRPIVATESGPSTQIPLLVVTAIRIQRAHGDEISVTPARASAPRVVKAHATNIRIFGG